MEYPPLSTPSVWCNLRRLFDEDTRASFANACRRIQTAHEHGAIPSEDDLAFYDQTRELIYFASCFKGKNFNKKIDAWREGMREGVRKEVVSAGRSLGEFALPQAYLLALFAPGQSWSAEVSDRDILKLMQL